MAKIIGISGKKQSGKNTVANYICGDVLHTLGMVKDFSLGEHGELVVKTSDSSGTVGWGVFDLLRKDADFVEYAEKELWPYVKIYHFADPLKQLCCDLFDIPESQLYGSNQAKNQVTQYNWKDMPTATQGVEHNLTVRDFLQYFGTDLMRCIKDTVWVDYVLKKIAQEDPAIALIPDVRFPNEIDAIKNAGGVAMRLDRNILESEHACEVSLDNDKFDWNKFDIVVNNDGQTLDQLQNDLKQINQLWDINYASNLR